MNLRVMRRTIADRSGLTETVASTELLHEREADDGDSDTQNQKEQVMKRDCVGKHTGSVASVSTQEQPLRSLFEGVGPVWEQVVGWNLTSCGGPLQHRKKERMPKERMNKLRHLITIGRAG